MSYKDILVHVDNSKHCANRLAVALNLAGRYGAHLTGLFVVPEITLPIYDGGPYPAELYEIEEEAGKKAAVEAKDIFEKAVAKSDVPTEWRSERGQPAAVVEKHGRYFDLIVLGQRDPDENNYYGDIADQIVLAAGRPLFVVPYIAPGKSPGDNIMVAWDGGAHATRAVHDALPFLEAADRVSVVTVNPHDAPAGHGDSPGADISAHLARHGVKATAESYTAGDVGVADMLLSRVADEGADMLVMGAYGHSRARELVLGGVTRHVLSHMTVPVLMSH